MNYLESICLLFQTNMKEIFVASIAGLIVLVIWAIVSNVPKKVRDKIISCFEKRKETKERQHYDRAKKEIKVELRDLYFNRSGYISPDAKREAIKDVMARNKLEERYYNMLEKYAEEFLESPLLVRGNEYSVSAHKRPVPGGGGCVMPILGLFILVLLLCIAFL